ncbi:MAG: ABC transporter ATP-binding protein [bacterium]
MEERKKINSMHVVLENGLQFIEKMNPDINIIVGNNGSGKTLLLNAISRKAEEEGISFAYLREDEVHEISQEAESWLQEMQREERKSISLQDWLEKKPCEERQSNWFMEPRYEARTKADHADSRWSRIIPPYSSGQKRLLGIISFVLKNKGKDVILIDKIENGIHLIYQEILVYLIHRHFLKSRSQLFIVTHAPGIIKKGWSNKTIRMHGRKNPPLERE